MMERGDLLTITVLILSQLIIGQSTMQPQVHSNLSGISWDSAATECGQYGLENDQYILRSISDLEGKTFWIGEKVYHVTLPWMEILGCFAENNISSTHHNMSLGKCQRQCMVSTYFGYKDDTRECVCLRDRGHNSGLDSCISRDKSNSFFVYTNFSDISFASGPDYGKNCMTSRCTNQVHFMKVYCNSKDSSVRGVCEDGSEAKTGPSQSNWAQTKFKIMQRCRSKNKLLPSSTYCFGYGNHIWTNMFRLEEVFEIKTDDAGNYKPIECVAATLNNKVLHKTHISCDHTVKYFVCKQESTTLKPDVTASTRFTSSSSHQTVGEKHTSGRPINLESTTKKYKAHQTSTGNHRETTSKQYSESGTMGAGQKIADKTSPVGAIAGGIVGFLVLVSLTVISLIICRRRQVCMFQHKKNPSKMSNTYADIPNTTSNSLRRSTDADVSGSNIINNKIYSGHFHADLLYSGEEDAHQNSNNIDTDSSLDLDCYDHLNAHNKRETMLSENLYSSNVGPRSNTDPTYDYSTTGTTQKRDANNIYDYTLESMNSRNVDFRNNTDPTYDDSTMCTIQGKDTNNIYDHTVKNMDSTCSNIDSVYAVSSKFKPAK